MCIPVHFFMVSSSFVGEGNGLCLDFVLYLRTMFIVTN